MCAPSRIAILSGRVVTAAMHDGHSKADFRGFASVNSIGQADLVATVDGCHIELVNLTQEARIALEVAETSTVVRVVVGGQSGSTPWDDSRFVQVVGQERMIPFSELPVGISGKVVALRGQVYVPTQEAATLVEPEIVPMGRDHWPRSSQTMAAERGVPASV